VLGSEFWIYGVEGLGFRASGIKVRIQVLGLRVLGFAFMD